MATRQRENRNTNNSHSHSQSKKKIRSQTPQRENGRVNNLHSRSQAYKNLETKEKTALGTRVTSLLEKGRENNTVHFFPNAEEPFVYFADLLNSHWAEYRAVGTQAKINATNFNTCVTYNGNNWSSPSSTLASMFPPSGGGGYPPGGGDNGDDGGGGGGGGGGPPPDDSVPHLIAFLRQRASYEAAAESMFLSQFQYYLNQMGETNIRAEAKSAITAFEQGLQNRCMPRSVYDQLLTVFHDLTSVGDATTHILDQMQSTYQDNHNIIGQAIQQKKQTDKHFEDEWEKNERDENWYYLKQLARQAISDSNQTLLISATTQLNRLFIELLDQLVNNQQFMQQFTPLVVRQLTNNVNSQEIEKKIRGFLWAQILQQSKTLMNNTKTINDMVNEYTNNFFNAFEEPLNQMTEKDLMSYADAVVGASSKNLLQQILDKEGYIAAKLEELANTDIVAYTQMISILDENDTQDTIAQLMNEMMNPTISNQDKSNLARKITGRLQNAKNIYQQRIRQALANTSTPPLTPSDILLNIRIAPGKAYESILYSWLDQMIDNSGVGGVGNRRADVFGVMKLALSVVANKINLPFNQMNKLSSNLLNGMETIQTEQLTAIRNRHNGSAPFDVQGNMIGYRRGLEKQIRGIMNLKTSEKKRQALLDKFYTLIFVNISAKDYSNLRVFSARGYSSGALGRGRTNSDNIARIQDTNLFENIITLLSVMDATNTSIDSDLLLMAVLNAGSNSIGYNYYQNGLKTLLMHIALDFLFDFSVFNIPKVYQRLQEQINAELETNVTLGGQVLDLIGLNGYLFPASYVFDQLANKIEDHWINLQNDLGQLYKNLPIDITIKQSIKITDIPAFTTIPIAQQRWEHVRDLASTSADIRIHFGLGLLNAFDKLGQFDFNFKPL